MTSAKKKKVVKKMTKKIVKKSNVKAAVKSKIKPPKKTVKNAKKAVIKKAAKKATKKVAVKKEIAKSKANKVSSKNTKPAKLIKKSSVKVVAKNNSEKKSSEKSFVSQPIKAKIKIKDLNQFFSPLDDRIFVSIANAEKRTAGGLYIPDTATTATGYFQGSVVACGPGHKNKKGKLKPLDVKLGDQILFSEYAGQKMILNINGQSEEFYVVRESDVLGIKS